MGKYIDLALSLREQKLKDDEALMASIKDKFLTDVAEQIGKKGFALFNLGASKPDWWAYGYNSRVLVRWAREEGFHILNDEPFRLVISLPEGLR